MFGTVSKLLRYIYLEYILRYTPLLYLNNFSSSSNIENMTERKKHLWGIKLYKCGEDVEEVANREVWGRWRRVEQNRKMGFYASGRGTL